MWEGGLGYVQVSQWVFWGSGTMASTDLGAWSIPGRAQASGCGTEGGWGLQKDWEYRGW